MFRIVPRLAWIARTSISGLLVIGCAEVLAPTVSAEDYTAITDVLVIDPRALPNYSAQPLPVYYLPQILTREVRAPVTNPITNAGATLGRVLFFDTQLSRTNSIACASCHLQSRAFGDTARFSRGLDGVGETGAHSMRLANARFNESGQYFWDRRAATLEAQATMPIRDAVEMGFDEANGGLAALISRLASLAYYPPLFRLAFGDGAINEDRIQRAVAQYVRSILAVNSRWDVAFSQLPSAPGAPLNFQAPLAGFTAAESRGQTLYFAPKNAGGAGCQGCHVAPSFSLAANSLNNGLDAGEVRAFRAPSLKNVAESVRFMHDGRFTSLEEVVEFYNSGIQSASGLDARLKNPGGDPQRLNLSAADKAALVAFLRTLTDQSVGVDPRFADPFRP